MARALYVSGDPVGETSGGLLAKHEIQALKNVFGEVEVLDGHVLNPANFKQPQSVFLYDYFGLVKIGEALAGGWGKVSHAHFYSWGFPQCVSLLKQLGIRTSYTVPAHDRRITQEEFHRLGLEYPFHHISDDNLWRLFSQGYREANLVIAQSEGSAKFLRDERCRNVKVVHAGADYPDKVAPFPEHFTVGYLGAAGPDKGLIYALKAWEKCWQEGDTFLIAGSGTENLEAFVRGTVNRGGFKLLGRVTSPSDLYNACSVYIQPSVVESFALEVPEAMGHGRPVIVTEGVGAKDIVEDGVTGFVIPIRDPDAIASKLAWLRDNPLVRAQMGAAAREKAKEVTWDKVEEHYTEVFRSVSA